VKPFRETRSPWPRHIWKEPDATLVVGSSLMVYSGFRFAQAASRRGIPIAAANLGRTRADNLLALKVEDHSEAAL
jgi:NAD-dependent SIR2 family protein deacetylase